MNAHPQAGLPAPRDLLIDPGRVLVDYYTLQPDPSNVLQQVSFGTSGHRGTPLDSTFTETHVLAMTQAICDSRRARGVTGPLFLGKDTHAVSRAAERTALEVLAANGVEVVISNNDGFVPTPVLSHAILSHNRGLRDGLADGIVITPSHNPPADGGFKYNPPNGGPADTDITALVEIRANELLREENRGVRRVHFQRALRAPTTHRRDLVQPYVDDLAHVVDLESIRSAGVRIGVDPLGGASAAYWEPIRDRYGLNLTVVNPLLDSTFGFMTLDHDGKIRMDCSSPYAMAGLLRSKDHFDVSFGCDPDADRHGIVTPSSGLLNPNHYLAVAIQYLLSHRPHWPAKAAVGKTLVSSAIIDRVVAEAGRELCEVPVGFKWFTAGLFDGSLCFGGEESAGASLLRRNGAAWVTDKDGIALGLLAAEITARAEKDPGTLYADLTRRLGTPCYRRIDAPATPAQKEKLKRLSPSAVTAASLAGDPITARLTVAPGNKAPIGGLKIVTTHGWFAARPSGTEPIYKLYAESFRGPEHLQTLIAEAQEIVLRALAG